MLALALLAASLAPASPRIQIPPPNAHPRSRWVALEGSAAPSAPLRILLDGRPAASATPDSSGLWDAVVLAGPGPHSLTACADACSPAVSITAEPPSAAPTPFDYSRLQPGDVILDEGNDSAQNSLYRSTYTHAALYLGPAPDGTPLIAEAVNSDLAGGLGDVRAVSPELSLAFAGASRVDLFRFAGDPSIPRRAAAWTRSTVARSPSFWSTTEDFAAIYQLWRLWNFHTDAPFNRARFAAALARLRARKWSLDRFNCATLVWRAFYEAGGPSADLSTPNLAFDSGSVLGITTPALLARVRPVIIVADTLARNGLLRPVP